MQHSFRWKHLHNDIFVWQYSSIMGLWRLCFELNYVFVYIWLIQLNTEWLGVWSVKCMSSLKRLFSSYITSHQNCIWIRARDWAGMLCRRWCYVTLLRQTSWIKIHSNTLEGGIIQAETHAGYQWFVEIIVGQCKCYQTCLILLFYCITFWLKM